MKRDMEATVMASHHQSIMTNAAKAKFTSKRSSLVLGEQRKKESIGHDWSAPSLHKLSTRAGTIK